MFADLHVVPDLDKIIDLGPLAYHGFAERGTIDRGASADLDVIFDSDNADLRDFVVLAAVRSKAVTIGADYDAAMDVAACAVTCVASNYTVRVTNEAYYNLCT